MTPRYTVHGGPEVEARIADALDRIREIGGRILAPEQTRALLLIGGYGRGEGGVEVTGGREVVHNNFDLLLVTRDAGRAARHRMEADLDAELRPLARELGIGIDLSLVDERRIVRGPVRVMWYDLRAGHRLLLGEDTFLREARHIRVEAIDTLDSHRLVRNRASLLLLNRAWVASGRITSDARIAIKHRAKAILGFGDALLFSRELYHWSYLEKARRIASLSNEYPEFARLFDSAMHFRLRPDYDAPPKELAHPLAPETLDLLRDLVLDFEATRAGTRIGSLDELRQVLAAEQSELRRRPTVEALRLLARGTVDALRTGRPARLFGRTADERMSLGFGDLLWNADTLSDTALDAYLHDWGVGADHNFAAVDAGLPVRDGAMTTDGTLDHGELAA